MAPLATQEFASWWHLTFKKLFVQPPNILLTKLKHDSILESFRQPLFPTREEEPPTRPQPQADKTSEV